MDLAPDTEIDVIKEILHDRAGKPYQLQITQYADGEIYAWLYDRDILVGQFNCSPKPDNTLELCQITIHNNAIYHEPILKSLIRQIRGHPRPQLNYRDLRLGNALLQSVIRFARKNGFLYIVGFIHPFDDGMDFDFLTNWYRKNGFIVTGGSLLYKIRP